MRMEIDFDRVEAFEALPPEEQAQERMRYLVGTSDLIRQMILEERLEEFAEEYGPQDPHMSLEEKVYWFIQQLHANPENPFIGLNADRAHKRVLHKPDQYFERGCMPETGKLRETEVIVYGYSNIDSKDLPLVAQEFFGVIADSLENVKDLSVEEKRRFLAKLDVIQTIAHFPLDASGRTNEDFMVYLAHKLGLSISVSSSGFRGYLVRGLEWEVEQARGWMREGMPEANQTANVLAMTWHLRTEYVEGREEAALWGMVNEGLEMFERCLEKAENQQYIFSGDEAEAVIGILWKAGELRNKSETNYIATFEELFGRDLPVLEQEALEVLRDIHYRSNGEEVTLATLLQMQLKREWEIAVLRAQDRITIHGTGPIGERWRDLWQLVEGLNSSFYEGNRPSLGW